MKGGIHAWEGQSATGSPSAGITWFSSARKPEEFAALAWHLEENTRLFYLTMAGLPSPPEDKAIFLDLAAAEEHHRKSLAGLYRKYSDSSSSIAVLPKQERYLEGGVNLEEALHWIHGKNLSETLGFALTMEVNAYDRYIKMLNNVKDEPSRKIFRRIAKDEKIHLKRIAALMDKRL